MTEIKTREFRASSNCPECGGSIIHPVKGGDVVCSGCGLVISERKITIKHARTYNSEERKRRSRTGSPFSKIFCADISFTTVIDKKRVYDPDLKRVFKWDVRINGDERGMLVALTEFKRIGTILSIPKYVLGSAILLYRKMKRMNQLRGRSLGSMVMGCILCSCRIHDIPRTFKEVIGKPTNSEIGGKVVNCIKVMLKKLKMKLPPPDPLLFIHRYCTELNLGEGFQAMVREIYAKYNDVANTSGKSPLGIVAGMIYFAVRLKGLNITQSDISEVVDVTEVTLRSRYTDICKFLGMDRSALR